MIELMSENDSIFDSGAEALVCPVNCVGVMGGGLAKEFKERFRHVFPNYWLLWKNKAIKVNAPLATCTCEDTYTILYQIIFFPTKKHWKDPSQLEYVKTGLYHLVEGLSSDTEDIESIAIPALGCGLGGLDWNDVRPLIEEAFKDLPDVRVMLYPPKGE